MRRNHPQIDFSKYNSSISHTFDCEVHDRPNDEQEKLEGQSILWTVRYIAHRTGRGINAYQFEYISSIKESVTRRLPSTHKTEWRSSEFINGWNWERPALANLHPSRTTFLLLRSLTLQQSATAGLASFSGVAFVMELRSSHSNAFSLSWVGEVSEFYP